MWRSENGGQNWTKMTIPSLTALVTMPFTASAAWFALIARVDPNDANTLYIGGIDLVRTDDGGNTWTHLSSEYPFPPEYTGNRVVHTDQHEILFFPGSSREALFSNDGGIYYSSDLNTTRPTFRERNHRYNTTQFYSCALFPDEVLYVGGAQDNGNWIIASTDLDPNMRYFFGGGDGGYAVVNQKNKFIFAVAATGIDMAITTDGAGSFTSYDLPGRGDFINPYTSDDDAEIFYGALDADKYFFIRELTKKDAFDSVSVPQFQGAQISALTADPHVSNRLWAAVRPYQGQGSAGLFRIDQANTHHPVVTELSDPSWNKELAARNIFIDANDPDYLLLTFANYGSPNVWISVNGGVNWTNVDGDLPDMPVRWGIINPLNREELILATELGVWHSTVVNGDQTQWAYYQEGMPKLRVNMLAYSEMGQRMVAATWGQGLFLTQYESNATSVSPVELAGIRLFPNPVREMAYVHGIEDLTGYQYKIFDLQGKLVTEGKLLESSIDTGNLHSGTYLVAISNQRSGLHHVFKMLKI
ncbi:MAG: T9SS type A sorting domain-containing protein [Saprospiraceae bacterium]